MIKILKIKNVALIKDVTIEFEKNFNVLMGETGAGKSIILSALNFVLGEKANKTSIRTGEDFMKVEASFVNYNKQISSTITDLGFEDDGVLFLSRTFYSDGKSENRINGMQVPLNIFKQVTSNLVDFYGQHENQILLRAKNHISLLESYNTSLFTNDKIALNNILNELKDIQSQKNEIGGNFENRERTIDLLNYQISEIENAKLKENEDELLENELKTYTNSEKISEILKQFISNFDSSNGVIRTISNNIHNLQNLSEFGQEFSDYKERLNSSLYEIEDITEEIKNISANLIFDENKINEIYNRLDHIKNLKRKYGPTFNDIQKYLQSAKTQLEILENAESTLQELSLKEEQLKLKAYEISKKLSLNRRSISKEIEEKICNELADLGMKNARFLVSFNEMPSHFDDNINKQGFDNIEFLFSANAGQELKPLSKIISGGEMSRFMLAMKNILADKDGVETLVFDEVDSGISGVIGNAVAEKLATLSKNFQVICITHLPQVSAMADEYIFVKKETHNNTTETKVEKLLNDKIYEHIAQLSGGDYKTELSIAHAKELKNKSEEFKMKIEKA